MITACSTTVAPKPVPAGAISFDGNNQNAGIITIFQTGPLKGNLEITSGKRAEYNALVARYGKNFTPPLGTDYGILPWTNGLYLIDSERAAKMILMDSWKRSGQ